MSCATRDALVDETIAKIATEYREAENLKAYLGHVLGQIADVHRELCEMPAKFDIDTAVGDQLTITGKWLGYPRHHPRGQLRPVFGFAGGPELITPIGGFDDAPWAEAGGPRFLPYTFSDDALYRAYLKVRRTQILGLFDYATLRDQLRALWGAQAFVVDDFRPGAVVLCAGRLLTTQEKAMLPLTVGVLPVPAGIRPLVHIASGIPFGFGTGWGGFDAPWLNPQQVPR